MEDGEIVALYWERSERALAESQAKYGAYCRAIALRLLGDAGEAEEAVNAALLEALLEPRADFAPGEVRTVTGTYTGGLSRQTLTSTQLDGSTGGTSTDTFITYSGPLGLLTVHGGSGYSSLRIELTPEQAAQLQFAGLALGDQVTVRFTGEPATIGTVWNQQLVSIEAAES